VQKKSARLIALHYIWDRNLFAYCECFLCSIRENIDATSFLFSPPPLPLTLFLANSMILLLTLYHITNVRKKSAFLSKALVICVTTRWKIDEGGAFLSSGDFERWNNPHKRQCVGTDIRDVKPCNGFINYKATWNYTVRWYPTYSVTVQCN
jgi:hypothetical protein